MRRRGKLIGTAAIFSVAACGGEQGKLEIRSSPTPLAAGRQAVPFRIAEARGQFALGNVALALESFRLALREDPNSIDAMMGVAACYDRMARFDLSRRHYEAALAIAPGDPKLLTAFAGSLDLQGQTAEAASVRAEASQRVAHATANAAPQRFAAAPVPQRVAQAVAPKPAAAPPVPQRVALAVAPKPRTSIEQPSPAAPVKHKVAAQRASAAPIIAQVAAKPLPSLAAVQPQTAPAPRPTAGAIGRSVTVALPPARSMAPPPQKQLVPKPAVETLAAVAPPPVRPVPEMAPAKSAAATAVTLALRPVPRVTEALPVKPAMETAVTAALPPARPVSEAAPAKPPVENLTRIARAEPVVATQTAPVMTGPRLERTSLREVALITVAAPKWKALTVNRTQRSATVRFVPLHHATLRLSGVRILNAARVNRLAARTRSYLVGRGWSPMTIGDAANVRKRSIIYYPPERRRTAQRLSAQFGFVIAQRPGTREITVLLGRDAARVSGLRA